MEIAPIEVVNALQDAIDSSRVPTVNEIMNQLCCSISVCLLQLQDKSATDPWKTSASLGQLVKAASLIRNFQQLEDIDQKQLENLSNSELLEYTTKLMDSLKS